MADFFLPSSASTFASTDAEIRDQWGFQWSLSLTQKTNGKITTKSKVTELDTTQLHLILHNICIWIKIRTPCKLWQLFFKWSNWCRHQSNLFSFYKQFQNIDSYLKINIHPFYNKWEPDLLLGIFGIFAKLSPSPSEAGLSKLYNHSGTINRQPPEHQKGNF